MASSQHTGPLVLLITPQTTGTCLSYKYCNALFVDCMPCGILHGNRLRGPVECMLMLFSLIYPRNEWYQCLLLTYIAQSLNGEVSLLSSQNFFNENMNWSFCHVWFISRVIIQALINQVLCRAYLWLLLIEACAQQCKLHWKAMQIMYCSTRSYGIMQLVSACGGTIGVLSCLSFQVWRDIGLWRILTIKLTDPSWASTIIMLRVNFCLSSVILVFLEGVFSCGMQHSKIFWSVKHILLCG